MTISQVKRAVLDEFEARTDDWSFGEFDRAMSAAAGGNYQTAKLAIAQADAQGSWPKTVERYIRTNHAAFGNTPAELLKIAARFNLKS